MPTPELRKIDGIVTCKEVLPPEPFADGIDQYPDHLDETCNKALTATQRMIIGFEKDLSGPQAA